VDTITTHLTMTRVTITHGLAMVMTLFSNEKKVWHLIQEAVRMFEEVREKRFSSWNDHHSP
jgi:hypothetical protein